ncbi:PepSY domain-containing protein [Nitrosococcus watsonii]|uniref:Peptidase n=1 Tax=Nitrosococcus watsoni (strain C-113) TaxID=105559 RepID=D8K5H9_NITWC|nr:PepSY domain-containing protein [Nitrosococcus watsonii]ADJ28156.1 peptidase [Nitrosococcus watsonii C-113]
MNIEQLSLIASILSLAGTMIGYTDTISVDPNQAVELVKEDKIQPFEQLNRFALAKHANATMETSKLESEYGHYTYKAELRDAQGIQWEVELDPTNGKIIRDQQDD